METRKNGNAIRLETREEGGGLGTLSGYIAVFNSDSHDMGGFVEQIRPGAFAESLRTNDVVALVNHDHGAVVGRLSAGTLRLSEDETGLKFEIDLPDTLAARDLKTLVGLKNLLGCSFGFEVLADSWSQKDGKDFCTLEKIRLWEVSVGVTFPAYPETSMDLRNRLKSRHSASRRRYRAKLSVLKRAS